MSGGYCPGCFKLTFFQTRTGRTCSKCGYSETNPAKEYLGEPGKRFNVDSLKYIGAKVVTPPRTARPVTAQGELDRLIKSAKKR